MFLDGVAAEVLRCNKSTAVVLCDGREVRVDYSPGMIYSDWCERASFGAQRRLRTPEQQRDYLRALAVDRRLRAMGFGSFTIPALTTAQLDVLCEALEKL